ncbi:hypothetical protein KP509_10G034300 [Ceratopteris richardii]|nr:hypothetical protein KP509_10G034300 [Ceratopteris richardii]
MKAFSSIRKMEKHEADLDVIGHRQEKVGLYLGGGCKYDSDDASMQASHKKTVHFDTHTEAEFSNVQEQKAGRTHCVSHSNLPSQHRKSRDMVGLVQRDSFDQRCNNNEGQRNTMMQYCGDDSDSESETENFVSRRNYDKERSLNKKSRQCYYADRPLCPEDVSSATESFGSGRATSKERDKYNKNKHQHAEHEYLDAGPESGVDVYNSRRKHSREGSRYLTSRQGYECFETDSESEIDDLSFRRKNREKCRYGVGRRGHVNIKSLSGVEYETKSYVSERSFFGGKSKSIKSKYHGHTDLDLDGGVVSRASSKREKKAGAVSDRSW